MGSNPYPTYEDAAQDYRAKLRALIQPPQEVSASSTPARGAVELPAEILIQRAEEIADISSSMIQLAQNYLDSADPFTREGICGHFIDQATVELLLATELIQATEEDAGAQSTAAGRATHSAALREAISAADKSSSFPVTQGLPTGESYRATESTTLDEAASALKLAVATTASSISRRVHELGKDIAFDLIAGTQGTEVEQGASLSSKEIAELLESIGKAPAARILYGVHKRISALLSRDIELFARGKIRGWLAQIKQADKIELFDAQVEGLVDAEGLKKAVASAVESSAATIESINKTSDLIKAFSDKLMVLTGRMRRLEDAIRLCKLIRIAPLLLTMTALQIDLLAALVYAGHDYINKGLAGTLREHGLLSSLNRENLQDRKDYPDPC